MTQANTDTTFIVNLLYVLNSGLQSDPQAISKLLETYVPCNERLANHKHIPTKSVHADNKEKVSVGVLGLFNGLLSQYGKRLVAQVDDETDKITEFKVVDIKRFVKR